MTNLIKCIECGETVSNEAYNCPHCHTRWHKGMSCVICTKILRASELKILKEKDDVPTVHAECLTQMKQCEYYCPACKNLINSHDMYRCNKCGHPIKRSSCHYCHEYVIDDLSVKVPSQENSGFDNGRAHKLCYSNRNHPLCFIATATLGSPIAPEVEILKKYRDRILRKYYFGKLFIRVYEKLSPPIAELIIRYKFIRYLTLFLVIYPVVWIAKLALGQFEK